ncbi:TetR family transcriptional regulator, partial [Mycobacterium sp. ITM-2017-0098]
FDMMAVALVGAGEAIASRVSTGDADVDEASELMINLFWLGLKGAPQATVDLDTDATAVISS